MSDLTVAEYELIASNRVDRTLFDYTYRVVARNHSDAFALDVTATVASVSAATVVRASTASFGDIAASGSRPSADTITIRQDRTATFNPGNLRWTFSADFVTGATPPPNPGSAGNTTLTGIDVNANEVRDDVERWVLATTQETPLRDALLEHARILQAGLTVGDDRDGARAIGDRTVRSVECLFNVTAGSGKPLLDELITRFVNTRERAETYFALDQHLEGEGFVLTPAALQAEVCARDN